MTNEINLPLRTEILQMALELEQDVSELILNHLNIEVEKRKALSNKSGSLSFQNKIDLLHDLGILTKEENAKFGLLMVFRNQFMHNINCNSFVTAINFLGDGKKKELLKFGDKEFNRNVEFHYRNAYGKLFINCIKVVVEKNERRLEVINENTNALKIPHEYSIIFIDKLMDTYVKICEECFPKESDNPKISEFKLKLLKTFTIELNNLDSTDEYKSLQAKFYDPNRDEIMKRFLKAK